ncbi:hypothetical protein ACMYYO_04340 [Dermacoccaceae bacterium W4C1]
MPDHQRSPVALRVVRRDTRSVTVHLRHRSPLVAQPLTDAALRLLVGLGRSSSDRLRHLSEQADPATRELLTRLAAAAERSVHAARRLDHVRIDGIGPISSSLQAVVSEHARLVTFGGESGRQEPVSLAVPVTVDALDLEACSRWAERGVAVLPVILRGDLVVVGPLLEPGGTPCARCVELTRCDRDPARARRLAGIDGNALDQLDPGTHEVQAAEIALCSGVVAAWVRARANGIPVPAGVSVSVQPPHPDLRHHAWETHPRCRRCTPDY